MSTKAIETISLQQFRDVMNRAENNILSTDDVALLQFIGERFFLYCDKLNEKNISIDTLKKHVFGSRSEKRNKVNQHDNKDKNDQTDGEEKKGEKKKNKQKNQGKGRNGKRGIDEYTEANTVIVPHDSLSSGDCCPNCPKGKAYGLEPSKEIRFFGQAPLGATRYEKEQFRCNLCQTYFKADLPEKAGISKFLPSAVAMMAILKYNLGLPFYRIAKLQESFKIPISESTQWETLCAAYDSGIYKLFEELQRASAQSHTIHIDDTTMRILEMMGRRRDRYLEGNNDANPKRTGIYTTCHVCISENYTGIVFKSGNKHAGENIERLIMKRNSSLPKPLIMSDALACNRTGDYKREIVSCLSHARRKFYDLEQHYPEESGFILDVYEEIYTNDAWTKQSGLSDEERKDYHHKHSKPLMDKLYQYLIDKKPLYERSNKMYAAIQYHIKNWTELNKFYLIPGVPLDNNICERVLKKPILNRKNAMFYKTQKGADVGDAYMSILHTCEMNGIHPFNYLETILSNLSEVSREPKEWLPWNYHLKVVPL